MVVAKVLFKDVEACFVANDMTGHLDMLSDVIGIAGGAGFAVLDSPNSALVLVSDI